MATTASSSRHHHRHRDRTNRSTAQDLTTLPTYEPPSAPLNPAGQRALAALLQSHSLRHLKAHLQHASEKLAETASEANERLTDARVRYERQKERRQQKQERRRGEGEDGEGEDDEGDDEEEEKQKLARMEERVNEVTGKLEETMRQVVDAEVKLDALTGVVGELGREADEANTQQGRRTRSGGGGRRRTRRRGEDEDEEDGSDQDYEEQEEEDDDEDGEGGRRRGEKPPSQKLEDKLAEQNAKWEGMSLTQRYTTNNAYIGFKRMVHDAQHPGDDIPPLPHASTWFSHLEDPASANAPSTSRATGSPPARRTRNRNRSASPAANDDDDDVAIARERISLRCPLTLQPFRDPVTSTKCPHSFEREAIETMIARSSQTAPAPGGPGSTGRPHRVRAVECPVCSVMLRLGDLRSDPVLLRRVKRAEAARQREDDEEAFDPDADAERRRRMKGSRQSGFTVADDDDEDENDDDAMDVDRVPVKPERQQEERVRIKRERDRSTAPDTQVASGGDDDMDEDE
ncbi:hypothetical protein VTN00DRAFT_4921 [Thermoascus crustaceus]|uniref:uncharacterized protein n=1 Tax=Thermoascus crustaceus TaxID=5088 RepID=UPI003744A910